MAEKPPRAYKERERTIVKKPTIKQRTQKAIVLKLGSGWLINLKPGQSKDRTGLD